MKSRTGFHLSEDQVYKIARVMVEHGVRQIRIREAFGHTQGCKYYWLALLNIRFPQLKIGKLNHVRHTTMQKLGRRIDKVKLTEVQKALRKSRKKLTAV